MKAMRTFSPYHRTVFSGPSSSWSDTFIGRLTNSAHFVGVVVAYKLLISENRRTLWATQFGKKSWHSCWLTPNPLGHTVVSLDSNPQFGTAGFWRRWETTTGSNGSIDDLCVASSLPTRGNCSIWGHDWNAVEWMFLAKMALCRQVSPEISEHVLSCMGWFWFDVCHCCCWKQRKSVRL